MWVESLYIVWLLVYGISRVYCKDGKYISFRFSEMLAVACEPLLVVVGLCFIYLVDDPFRIFALRCFSHPHSRHLVELVGAKNCAMTRNS